mmetsp:Transcript_7583/g.20679  ORF Transcript_7583/g.20679 Transcript_7583/m.20679 type:complete len:235 (-) Transcript_7583:1667-2371(-)
MHFKLACSMWRSKSVGDEPNCEADCIEWVCSSAHCCLNASCPTCTSPMGSSSCDVDEAVGFGSLAFALATSASPINSSKSSISEDGAHAGVGTICGSPVGCAAACSEDTKENSSGLDGAPMPRSSAPAMPPMSMRLSMPTSSVSMGTSPPPSESVEKLRLIFDSSAINVFEGSPYTTESVFNSSNKMSWSSWEASAPPSRPVPEEAGSLISSRVPSTPMPSKSFAYNAAFSRKI